jgi:hypothetical protein
MTDREVSASNASARGAVQASRLKPPSWLDGRLVAGAVLVLISVAVGAKLVASSDRYDVMWAASHDVAAGSIVTAADLREVRVKFHDAIGHATGAGAEQGYFPVAGATIVGRTASVALFAGQLIPVGAVPLSAPNSRRLVTLPVSRLHMPKGAAEGMQVDLYVTVKSDSADGESEPELVLADVTIADTITDSSGLGDSGGSGVVLSVPIADVDAVVAAAEAGSVDLVRVPIGQTTATPSPGDFIAGLASPAASADSSVLPVSSPAA